MYAVQHLMLVGITLPWRAIAFSPVPWTAIDTVAAACGALGIAFAAVADGQLYAFTCSASSATPQVLRTGLWAFSRHPAHFGEQLWWWSAAMFAVSVGQTWTASGTLFNSACMVPIMQMVEERMMRKTARRQAMLQYIAEVPFCVPLLSVKTLRRS